MITFTTPPSLSASVSGLLSVLARDAAPNDVLQCRRHAGSALGANVLDLRAGDVSPRWIPVPLLTTLERDADSCWTVSVARRPANASGVVLPAVAVSFAFERIFANPENRDSKYGRRWIFDEAAIREALDRAAAFLPPTVIVSSGRRLDVVWGLVRPRPVPNFDSGVRNLVRRVAERIGAAVPPNNTRLSELDVALPGFNAPDGFRGRALCIHLDAAKTYDLADLEAALDAATATTARPRRRAQEVS